MAQRSITVRFPDTPDASTETYGVEGTDTWGSGLGDSYYGYITLPVSSIVQAIVNTTEWYHRVISVTVHCEAWQERTGSYLIPYSSDLRCFLSDATASNTRPSFDDSTNSSTYFFINGSKTRSINHKKWISTDITITGGFYTDSTDRGSGTRSGHAISNRTYLYVEQESDLSRRFKWRNCYVTIYYDDPIFNVIGAINSGGSRYSGGSLTYSPSRSVTVTSTTNTLTVGHSTNAGFDFIKYVENGVDNTNDSITYSFDLSTITSSTTTVHITAYFDPKEYTVSFDSRGGTPVSSKVVKYGCSFDPPQSTRDGYTFLGWSAYEPEVSSKYIHDRSHNVPSLTNNFRVWFNVFIDPNYTTTGYLLYIGSYVNIYVSGSTLYFRATSSSTTSNYVTHTLNNGYNQICLRRSGSSYYLYVNGSLVGTPSFSTSYSSDTYIGSGSSGSTGSISNRSFSDVVIHRGVDDVDTSNHIGSITYCPFPEDCTLYAVWAIDNKLVTITSSPAGSGTGKITLYGTTSSVSSKYVPYGSDISVGVDPTLHKGGRFLKWEDDDSAYNPRQITGVVSDMSFSALFDIFKFTVGYDHKIKKVYLGENAISLYKGSTEISTVE